MLKLVTSQSYNPKLTYNVDGSQEIDEFYYRFKLEDNKFKVQCLEKREGDWMTDTAMIMDFADDINDLIIFLNGLIDLVECIDSLGKEEG